MPIVRNQMRHDSVATTETMVSSSQKWSCLLCWIIASPQTSSRNLSQLNNVTKAKNSLPEATWAFVSHPWEKPFCGVELCSFELDLIIAHYFHLWFQRWMCCGSGFLFRTYQKKQLPRNYSNYSTQDVPDKFWDFENKNWMCRLGSSVRRLANIWKANFWSTLNFVIGKRSAPGKKTVWDCVTLTSGFWALNGRKREIQKCGKRQYRNVIEKVWVLPCRMSCRWFCLQKF